jgi:hypothetical protein
MDEEVKVSQAGVEITITDISDELEGWDKFLAHASNTSEGPRTVNGQILVHTADDEIAGECTVYLELPPGETKSTEFTVKVTEGVKARWSFKLVKVYEF